MPNLYWKLEQIRILIKDAYRFTRDMVSTWWFSDEQYMMVERATQFLTAALSACWSKGAKANDAGPWQPHNFLDKKSIKSNKCQNYQVETPELCFAVSPLA